ncbi:MAG: hypothetical protein ACAI35_12385 [Candidatus Methylacidiphilales bacterium]|nr:hypothetical protein [Candidatus Methylacidiphilales bacterium]
MNTSVFATVSNRSQTESILAKLHAFGFTASDLSVLYSDSTAPRDLKVTNSTKSPEAAVIGGTSGGVLGGIAGWVLGAGAIAIPGVGPFIAAGPIMAALSGVAIGASVGSISGALAGLGITELEAQQYEGKLREGNVLISVHCESSEEVSRAKQILEEEGAKDICSTAEAAVPKT